LGDFSGQNLANIAWALADSAAVSRLCRVLFNVSNCYFILSRLLSTSTLAVSYVVIIQALPITTLVEDPSGDPALESLPNSMYVLSDDIAIVQTFIDRNTKQQL